MAKVYIVKLSTERSLSDLMRRLEPIGAVISFREAEALETAVPGMNGVSAPQVKRQVFYSDPKAVSEARRKSSTEFVNRRRQEVYPVMAAFLMKHQHAPLDTIVKLMNESSVRPIRNGAWNNYNIKPYLEYTLAKMTSPNEPSIPMHSSEQA